jgi:hypothetical protein
MVLWPTVNRQPDGLRRKPLKTSGPRNNGDGNFANHPAFSALPQRLHNARKWRRLYAISAVLLGAIEGSVCGM